MADLFVCRLDSEKGTITGLSSEDLIFTAPLNSTIEFQLQPGSKFASASTELITTLNSSSEVSLAFEDRFGVYVSTLQMTHSGSLKFYLKKGEVCSTPDYIVIDPILQISGQQIKSESLSMLTLLSRSLGPISRWESIFEDQISLGYNFFHVTPVQVLGGSNSLYCIKDPNNLSPLIFGTTDQEEAYDKLQTVIQKIDDLGAGCMIDIVLNHIAYDTEFVEEHPEATYNLKNSPYLRSAYELDNALDEFSQAIIQKKIQGLRNKNKIENQKDLTIIMTIIKLEWLPKYKLHEYFQMDAARVLKSFESCTEETHLSASQISQLKTKGLEYFMRTNSLKNEGEGPFSTEIDYPLVWRACSTLGYTRENSVKEVKKILQLLNSYLLSRYDKHFAEILTNIEGDIRYHKIEKGKPEITSENPLVTRYFQVLRNREIVLHNGFVMGYNEVLKDFAGKEGWHYFRRNVVIWGDNIKLRYGNSYEDCPALWETMKNYVVQMAKIFKAIRLDNAHGTSLEVSAYMLQAAREVNPNLYVMAELFTSDCKLDAYFVKVLGINSLVREAMNAQDPSALGGLIYSYGLGDESSLGRIEGENNQSLLIGRKNTLQPFKVKAAFYDCTHDNPTPAERRKPQDALPSAGLVSMANCLIASSRGYDEFVPEQLSVVKETRLYLQGSQKPAAKKYELGGEVELLITFSAEENQKIQTVQVKGEWDNWTSFFDLTKVSETNYEVVLMVSYELLNREVSYKFVVDGKNWLHDFKQPYRKYGNNINNYVKVNHHCKRSGIYSSMRDARKYLNTLHKEMGENGFTEIYVHQCSRDLHMVIRQNPATGDSFVLIARNAFWEDSNVISQYDMKLPGIITDLEFLAVLSFRNWGFIKDANFINGLKGHLEVFSNLDHFGSVHRDSQGVDILNLDRIPQGFVCVLKTELASKGSLQYLNNIYSLLESPKQEVFNGLTLENLNHLLWRCSSEELDISQQRRDVYKVSKPFIYAGIAGLVVEFKKLLGKNSLGHDICANLRAGDWMIDYTLSRLQGVIPEPCFGFISAALQKIKQLPRSLIPKHFIKFTLALFEGLASYQISTLFKVKIENRLERLLYTSISQFWGSVPSSACDRLRSSMSAGLPHFTTGYTRNWGRDTFIAIKGLLLLTSQFSEAKTTILAYASVVRHGLVPNLLDSCRNSRFNSRDSTWFFLNAIKQYIKLAPKGSEILQETVSMVFKSDVQSEHQAHKGDLFMSLEEIIQSILQKHALGIEFREWNAGSQIDSQMREEGFNVRIGLDTSNGMVYGGNRWNCGTWMDKMGSSAKARNAGVPATPRDGSAIEIIGLVYSFVTFLVKLHTRGIYRYSGVRLRDGSEFLFTTWAENLRKNTDKLFFVPENADRVSGFYKDTLGSSVPKNDNQLRPNQCVALAVSPKLFDRKNAAVALNTVLKELFPGLGESQVGLKTLNDSDPAYRGFYDNANDSDDPSVAHGFSYHNGPEWVWPVGYFLLAYLKIIGDREVVLKCLKTHLTWFEKSEWMSLPELTNWFGEECPFSCKAQAWSIGPLIEVVQKLKEIN